METKIEPCPFCGSPETKTREDVGFGRLRIVCEGCGAKTRYVAYSTKDDYEAAVAEATEKAIQLWNTRYQPKPPRPKKARLHVTEGKRPHVRVIGDKDNAE